MKLGTSTVASFVEDGPSVDESAGADSASMFQDGPEQTPDDLMESTAALTFQTAVIRRARVAETPRPSQEHRPTPLPPSFRITSTGPFSLPQESAPFSSRAPGLLAQPDSLDVTVSDVIVQHLKGLGVHTAFGLIGGAVAPFSAALARGGMKVVHCRHEAGAVFAAIEAYYVKDRPCVVFTTAGPGLTNALTGLAAARRDGAKVILISGSTGAPHRGRWAFQETSAYTMPISGLFTSGPLFHYAVTIEQPVELFEALRRITAGLQRPGGFVAHISLPTAIQATGDIEPFSSGPISMVPAGSTNATGSDCADLLKENSFAIWVGFGARHAWQQVRDLASRSGAMVMCSPRAKGIFPEDHPQFIGVTGFGGHDSVLEHMKRRRPAYTLVLGTRLGEFTSFWEPDMLPEKAFIHVDIDAEVPGVAYPNFNTIGIHAEIGEFLDGLLKHFPVTDAPVPEPRQCGAVLRAPRSTGPVRPDFLMAMIQYLIVEKSDAAIITEAGNAFAWGTHSLRFSSPKRYRVSTGFGSMGHAVTGVVGMAFARGGKAVALAGDGAMLMNSEVSTAVQYKIPAVWIVLNDSLYGMIHQGFTALQMPIVETAIPQTNFAMIAEGMGAEAVRVECEEDLGPALEQAMAATGPFVVDVVIDRSVNAPAGRRFKSLEEDQFS